MKEHKIPDAILSKGDYYVKRWGNGFKYLGKYEEADVYYFQLPEKDLCIGFPIIMLYKDGVVEELHGKKVFKVLRCFFKK